MKSKSLHFYLNHLQTKFKGYALFPYHDVNFVNVVKGKKRNLSFKNVLLIEEALKNEHFILALELLNCETPDEFEKVMKEIHEQRWIEQKLGDLGLSKEDEQALNEAEKMFDYNMDYDAYYVDFFKIGIDLDTSDLDWYKFNWFLSSFFDDENSTISKRLQYRGYKPNKHDSLEYKNSMNKRKSKYSYQEVNSDNFMDIFGKGVEIGGK